MSINRKEEIETYLHRPKTFRQAFRKTILDESIYFKWNNEKKNFGKVGFVGFVSSPSSLNYDKGKSMCRKKKSTDQNINNIDRFRSLKRNWIINKFCKNE